MSFSLFLSLSVFHTVSPSLSLTLTHTHTYTCGAWVQSQDPASLLVVDDLGRSCLDLAARYGHEAIAKVCHNDSTELQYKHVHTATSCNAQQPYAEDIAANLRVCVVCVRERVCKCVYIYIYMYIYISMYDYI